MVTLGEEELLICSQELQILIAAVVANGFHLHRVNEWITDGMESELAVSMCCIGLWSLANGGVLLCSYDEWK